MLLSNTNCMTIRLGGGAIAHELHAGWRILFRPSQASPVTRWAESIEWGFEVPKQCFGTSHVPLSPAVRAGDFVFISGQVPVGPDGLVVKGGIAEQTEQVLQNVKAALELAGCTM